MGSYLIDNATATQGGYAGVVASTQNSHTARQVNPASVNQEKNLAKVPPAGAKEKSTFNKEEEKNVTLAELTDEENLEAITEALNDFVSELNVNLRFTLHRDTSTLRVTFVDIKNNKVLKEFPPEEYLDMIAKIRKFIGTIIDEKA